MGRTDQPGTPHGDHIRGVDRDADIIYIESLSF